MEGGEPLSSRPPLANHHPSPNEACDGGSDRKRSGWATTKAQSARFGGFSPEAAAADAALEEVEHPSLSPERHGFSHGMARDPPLPQSAPILSISFESGPIDKEGREGVSTIVMEEEGEWCGSPAGSNSSSAKSPPFVDGFLAPSMDGGSAVDINVEETAGQTERAVVELLWEGIKEVKYPAAVQESLLVEAVSRQRNVAAVRDSIIKDGVKDEERVGLNKGFALRTGVAGDVSSWAKKAA